MTKEPIEFPNERPDVWRSAANDKPPPNTWIIILDDCDRIHKGYMRKFFFHTPHESEPTYSFHGEYYDFYKKQHSFGLVNAVAWMPMPKTPQRWIKDKERPKGFFDKMIVCSGEPDEN